MSCKRKKKASFHVGNEDDSFILKQLENDLNKEGDSSEVGMDVSEFLASEALKTALSVLYQMLALLRRWNNSRDGDTRQRLTKLLKSTHPK